MVIHKAFIKRGELNEKKFLLVFWSGKEIIYYLNSLRSPKEVTKVICSKATEGKDYAHFLVIINLNSKTNKSVDLKCCTLFLKDSKCNTVIINIVINNLFIKR